MEKLKRHIPPVLFGLYMAALLGITVVRPGGGYRFLGGSLHLTILADYLPVLRNSVFRFLYLFGGNIVWFMPFGFYLTCRKGMSVPRAVLLGFGLSLFIETMQFVLGTGISEPDDLILNTLGSFLGGSIGKKWRR